MRLNLVTGEHLERINWAKASLSVQVKDRLSLLASPTFKPEYKRVEPKHVLVVLSNPNCLDLVYQKQPFIITMLEKMNGEELGQLLGCFAHDKPETKPVLNAIIEGACEKMSEVVMGDLQSLLRNVMNKNLVLLSGRFKGLAIGLMEEMVRVEVGRSSLQTHLDAISFLTSQPNLPSSAYYSALVEQYSGSPDNYSALLSKLVTSNYSVRMEDLSVVEYLASRKPSQALKVFLMAESNLPKERATELAGKIVAGFAGANEKAIEKVYSEFVDYFKKTYP